MGTRKNDRSVSYSQVDRTYVNAVCLSFFLIGLSLSLSPFFFSGEGRKGGCYCCCCLPTYLASNFAPFSSVGRQDGVTSQLFTRPPVVKETAWIPFEGGCSASLLFATKQLIDPLDFVCVGLLVLNSQIPMALATSSECLLLLNY